MDLPTVFQRLGIALGLGLLVGLQRERTNARLAGFRTFPITTVLGALSALLAETMGGWVIGLGLIGLAVLLLAGNLQEPRDPNADTGITTEVAMLAMYALGAYVVVGHVPAAVAVGGGVAVLLHLKPQLHAFAARVGQKDVTAIMQFVLISLVILPVLPDRAYGPYLVLNPFRIWVMVVLIVGISLGGYLAYKLLGERLGALAGGILGGLISSTATTVSYARLTQADRASGPLATFVILAASSVLFVRVLIVVGATAPELLRAAWGPLTVMFATFATMAGLFWISIRTQKTQMPQQENPSELKGALVFAAIYAVVLLAVAAAQDRFGARGLYVVALLSGLTDMDAITLSVTGLAKSGEIPLLTAWRLLVLAQISNTVFKAGVILALGDRRTAWRVVGCFGLAVGVGCLILRLWPE